MFKAVREVKIGECTANQALKKQPLAWYLKDKKDSSRAEFFVTAFVLCVLCFGLFGFSRGFCCPKPNCPKTRGKPKKTKNQSCEKNLG